MSVYDNNTNGGRSAPFQVEDSVERIGPQVPPVAESNEHEASEDIATPPSSNFATRAGINVTPGIGKNKLIILGVGLAVAVLFFVFTAIVGKSPKKQTTAKPKWAASKSLRAKAAKRQRHTCHGNRSGPGSR